MECLTSQKLEHSIENSGTVIQESESEINNVGKMNLELHIDIIDFNVNGKKHSGMLSKANWWTGIKG
jgi:hypothetical protein